MAKKKNTLIELIPDEGTPRKCSTCLKAAAFWRFGRDLKGDKDKSSKRPVCAAHTAA
jgi:hypothetical protein